jgi:hypothetical protein
MAATNRVGRRRKQQIDAGVAFEFPLGALAGAGPVRKQSGVGASARRRRRAKADAPMGR